MMGVVQPLRMMCISMGSRRLCILRVSRGGFDGECETQG